MLSASCSEPHHSVAMPFHHFDPVGRLLLLLVVLAYRGLGHR
jgi:hypothetical protein